MPTIEVVFYRDERGAAPVLDWLKELRAKQPRAFAKCVVRVRRLAELGHEIRRPEADYLRDGIHELRARLGTVNYRILFFFHGRTRCVLAHGLVKKRAVPHGEIARALARKALFEQDPEAHAYHEWEADWNT